MIPSFQSRIGADLARFVAFKRALGYTYRGAEEKLRSFDRYVATHSPARGRLPLEPLVRGWLTRIEGRKPITVARELGSLREFFRFRRRTDRNAFMPAWEWQSKPKSHFVPHVFSTADVKRLLAATASLPGHSLRRCAFRTLILILYCTGLRIGEALRLQSSDVDLRRRVLVVRKSKGKTRLVPFRSDLARVLQRFRRSRRHIAESPDGPFLVRPDGRGHALHWTSAVLRNLLRREGLKPPQGRGGPRPFDFRHTFAVHRLTRWYRNGVDLHARLPWLSAYMGHDNLLGTETYLTTTPALLAVASRRFEARVKRPRRLR